MIIKISKIVNIIGGFILGAHWLEKNETIRPYIQKGASALKNYENTIGIIELGIGGAIIIERVTSLFRVPYLGSTYPQAIAALGVGFMLSKKYFGETALYKTLEPYSEYIGLAGFALGALSLVF